MELPYENTMFYQRQGTQQQQQQPKVGCCNDTSSSTIDGDPTISSNANKGSASVADPERSFSNDDAHPGDEKDVRPCNDDDSDVPNDSSVSDNLDPPGGLGIGRMPEEMMIAKQPRSSSQQQQQQPKWGLKLVCVHHFGDESAAADPDEGESKSESRPLEESFESVSSRALIESILELEKALEQRATTMTESERAGFVRAMECRIQKLTERGYERVDD